MSDPCNLTLGDSDNPVPAATFTPAPARKGARELLVCDSSRLPAAGVLVVEPGPSQDVIRFEALAAGRLALAAPGLAFDHAAGVGVAAADAGEGCGDSDAPTSEPSR